MQRTQNKKNKMSQVVSITEEWKVWMIPLFFFVPGPSVYFQILHHKQVISRSRGKPST